MTARDAARLLPLSPIDQTPDLFVGQKRDAWPQVHAVDEHGVSVQGLEVQFEVSAAATFGDDSTLRVRTNRLGRAIAQGLRGLAAGPAQVTVTVPTAPDVEPLRYQADVIAAPGQEALTERT